MAIQTIACIGSFKQHYGHVQELVHKLKSAAISVTSPAGTPIIEEGIQFVRFKSDPTHWPNIKVQTVALHRILRAEMVYVVAPSGYVGKTTCYEIGRIIQAYRPLYFSEMPDDLPIRVSKGHVIKIGELADVVRQSGFSPTPLYDGKDPLDFFENELANGRYWLDNDIEQRDRI